MAFLCAFNSLSQIFAYYNNDVEEKNGISLLDEIRRKKILTPVLLVSAKDTVEVIDAGLDAGADNYLRKPFAVAELIARVKALQRRASRDRGAKIFLADLCLDPVQHRVWRGEKEIGLTAREYELLEFMVWNRNQVITRNVIADEVWEGGFDSFTNIGSPHETEIFVR